MENVTIKEKRPNPVYRFFDKFFHFSEHGTNIKTEIFAGILAFIGVACTTFLLASVITSAMGNSPVDASGFSNDACAIYVAICMLSAVSSILVGLIANVPFVQSTSLGMVSLISTLLGTFAGLTYYNILFIALISNAIYLVVMLVKPAREFILKAVPASVKKAIPAATGALLIVYTLVNLGILNLNTLDLASDMQSASCAGDPISKFAISYISLNFDASNKADFYSYMPVITATFSFLLMLILKSLKFNIKGKEWKFKHPTIVAFGIGLLIYVIYWAIRGNFTDYYFYSFVVPSYASFIWMHFRTKVFKKLCIFTVFTKGLDFSGYTGNMNIFFVFIISIVSFVVLGVAETGSTYVAHSYLAGECDENGTPMYRGNKLYGPVESYANPYSATALCSVLGCMFGAGPMVARNESTLGSHEGGRTGLTAIVAGCLFIVTCFNMVFNGLFMNEMIIGGITLFVGFSLLTSLKNIDWSDVIEAMPSITLIVVAAATTNIVLAISVGVVCDLLLKIIRFKFKEITIGQAVLSVILLANIAFTTHIL